MDPTVGMTAGMDRMTRLWTTDPDQVARRICRLAQPRLTRAEWDRHLPGVEFQPPCP